MSELKDRVTNYQKYKEYQRAYYLKNYDKIAEVRKKQREQKYMLTHVRNTHCLYCQKPIPDDIPKSRRYCNYNCNNAYLYRKKKELIKDQQARIEELEKQVVLAKGTFEHIAFMDMQGMRFPNISEAFLYVRGQATEVLKHFKIESIEGK
jgi:thioredoxin-related protein